jgi:dextranase
MIKEWSHYIIISMINLINSDDQWNEKKSKSITGVSDIKLRVLMEKEIKGVYYSTPDEYDCAVHELEYRTDFNHMGRFIEVTVPSLLIWDYLWIDFSEEGE